MEEEPSHILCQVPDKPRMLFSGFSGSTLHHGCWSDGRSSLEDLGFNSSFLFCENDNFIIIFIRIYKLKNKLTTNIYFAS